MSGTSQALRRPQAKKSALVWHGHHLPICDMIIGYNSHQRSWLKPRARSELTSSHILPYLNPRPPYASAHHPNEAPILLRNQLSVWWEEAKESAKGEGLFSKVCPNELIAYSSFCNEHPRVFRVILKLRAKAVNILLKRPGILCIPRSPNAVQ